NPVDGQVLGLALSLLDDDDPGLDLAVPAGLERLFEGKHFYAEVDEACTQASREPVEARRVLMWRVERDAQRVRHLLSRERHRCAEPEQVGGQPGRSRLDMASSI